MGAKGRDGEGSKGIEEQAEAALPSKFESLPTRRSFGVFVNLLVGSLGLADFYTKLWHLQVGSLVTWLGESVNLPWARLPVPPQLLLLTLPTQVTRQRCYFSYLDLYSSHFRAEYKLTPVSNRSSRTR